MSASGASAIVGVFVCQIIAHFSFGFCKTKSDENLENEQKQEELQRRQNHLRGEKKLFLLSKDKQISQNIICSDAKRDKTKIWSPFSDFLLLSRLQRKKQNKIVVNQVNNSLPVRTISSAKLVHTSLLPDTFSDKFLCFTWKRWDKKTRITFYLVRKHSLIHYLGSLGFDHQLDFTVKTPSFQRKYR